MKVTKYPIGIQNFGEVRRDGYAYVDKTDLMYKMVSEGKYYFLSRQRAGERMAAVPHPASGSQYGEL